MINIVRTCVIAVALAGAVGCQLSAADRTAESRLPVPDRVISGYSGFFLGADPSHVDRMIDQLADHGFNSIDIKIQTSDRKKFDLEGHKAEVKRLVDHARARGLAFNVYLYPFPQNPGKSAQPLDDPDDGLSGAAPGGEDP